MHSMQTASQSLRAQPLCIIQHEQKIVFDSCCIHIRNDKNYAYCTYRVTTTIRVVYIKCTSFLFCIKNVCGPFKKSLSSRDTIHLCWTRARDQRTAAIFHCSGELHDGACIDRTLCYTFFFLGKYYSNIFNMHK